MRFFPEAAAFPTIEFKYELVMRATDALVFVLSRWDYAFSPASEQMPKFVNSI